MKQNPFGKAFGEDKKKPEPKVPFNKTIQIGAFKVNIRPYKKATGKQNLIVGIYVQVHGLGSASEQFINTSSVRDLVTLFGLEEHPEVVKLAEVVSECQDWIDGE